MQTNPTPAQQLFTVCGYEGATPERIRKHAPFLEPLPATKDALRALEANGITRWEDAAYALLNCVVRPGGALGLEEQNAYLTKVFLGLGDVPRSLTQRLADLINQTKYHFPTASATQDKWRKDLMETLAIGLLSLDHYPCASRSKIEKAAKYAAEQIEMTINHFLGDADPEDLHEYRELVISYLEGIAAFFEEHGPELSIEEQFEIVVRGVIIREYLPKVRRLGVNAFEVFLEGRVLLDLLNGKPNAAALGSTKFTRSVHLFAELLHDVDTEDRWEQTLLAAEAEGETGLETDAEWQQQMRRYLDEWKDSD